MKKMINIIVTVIMTVSMIVGVNVNAKAEAVDTVEVSTMSELVKELTEENHFKVVTYKNNDISVTYNWKIESEKWFDEWRIACPDEVSEVEDYLVQYGMSIDEFVAYYTNWHLATTSTYGVNTLVMT
jgi:hypothetical protein